MTEYTHETGCGTIHYFADILDRDAITLIFLPGLTADHRLFEKQIDHFEGKMNILTWDAPGHGASRPFTPGFGLDDKARWLKEILDKEGISSPVIVGQSMGGYVGQAFAQLFPQALKGFISIDSAPLQKRFNSPFNIWFMKNAGPMYRLYPWKALLKDGSRGCAETAYGIELMKEMMLDYNPKEYAALAGAGYKMLAEAIEKNLPYRIECPAMLICGEQDKAGLTVSYNRKWHADSGIPIHWIAGAGHNSNTDKPDEINALIEEFVPQLLNQGPRR